MNPSFLGWDNITNVLSRSAFIGIIADRLITAWVERMKARRGLA